MRKVISYIKSLDFAFLVCVTSMSGQSFHTFYSFHAVSNIPITFFRILESVLLVMVFEAFTLFYLMRGRSGMAMFYSACLFVMNCYYYIDSGVSGPELWMGVFLSIIIPVSIYFVAEEVKKDFEMETPEKKEGFEERIVAMVIEKIQGQFSKPAKSSKSINLDSDI